MTWRIGASTGCCTEMPIERVIDGLAETRIRGVEIGTPPRHFDPWREDHVNAVRDRLAATGVHAVSMHAPFGGAFDISAPQRDRRETAVHGILGASRALRRLGGDLVVVHPSDAPRGPDAATRLADSADALRRLQHACGREGLRVAIETPLPHLVGGAPDEFAWLVEQVGADARVCIDTGHTTLGGHWDAFITRVGSRIVHVHATDHLGRYDDHLPPGDGTIDWAHIARSLRTLHYEGWIMLELRCPAEPLGQYFRRAADALQRRLDGGR